jgi:hypothetical protein
MNVNMSYWIMEHHKFSGHFFLIWSQAIKCIKAEAKLAALGLTSDDLKALGIN